MQKIKSVFKTIVYSPVTFFVLIGLYPVVFLTSKNWFVYEPQQLLFLLSVPCTTGLLALILTGFVWLVRRFVLEKLPNRLRDLPVKHLGQTGVWRVTLSLLGFYIFYVLLEESITKHIIIIYGFITFVFIVVLIIKKVGFRYINMVFLVMILLSFAELLHSISVKSIRGDTLLPSLNKEADSLVKFKKTPNIYLFHLESYQSPTAMKRIYGYDNQEFDQKLNDLGFYVSQNNFANYSSTLPSVGSMFLQQHHFYKLNSGIDDAVGIRDMVGGRLYNPVLAVLKNNQYKLIYIHYNVYNFMGSAYLDYYYPSNNIQDSLLIFQSPKIEWLRSKLLGLQNPKKKNVYTGNKQDFRQVLWDKIEGAKNSTEPYFFYIKDAALGHTPHADRYTWADSDNGWVKSYQDMVKRANPEILKTVTRVIKDDPEGIIILYGDHGASRYRNIWAGGKEGEDVSELIYNRKQITTEDLALDLFGTFMAVRYPNGDNKLLDGETHVNLFRKLFSDLSQNQALMENAPANNSYIWANTKQLYVAVKDGKVLQKIETMNIPK